MSKVKSINKIEPGQDVFLPFKVLSFNADQRAIEKYQKNMQGWEEAIEEWEGYSEIERMGNTKPQRPKAPSFTSEYRDIYLNFGDKTVCSFLYSYDEENKCDRVLLDVVNSLGEPEQYHIQCSLEVFKEKMSRIGAIFIEE